MTDLPRPPRRSPAPPSTWPRSCRMQHRPPDAVAAAPSITVHAACTGLPEIAAGRRPGRADRRRGARTCATATSWSSPPRSSARPRAGSVRADREAGDRRRDGPGGRPARPTTGSSQTRHGLVLAAAGVDASNTAPGTVVLLPEDPDGSARRLRGGLRARLGRQRRRRSSPTRWPAVAHRPDRRRDRRGRACCRCATTAARPTRFGNLLEVTVAAVADEIAAAADLVKGKTTQIPVAIVRGPGRAGHRRRTGPGAAALVRPADEDMFRLGAADVLAERRTVREFTDAAGGPGRGAAGGRRRAHRAGAAPQRAVAVRGAGVGAARTALLDAMLAAWVSRPARRRLHRGADRPAGAPRRAAAPGAR